MSKMANKNNFALDFKDFKKTKSDDKTTTLTHKDGHSITVAHKALPAKIRGQLAELPMHLAEGGEAVSQEIQQPEASQPQAPVTINIASPNAAQAPAQDYIGIKAQQMVARDPSLSLGDAMAKAAMEQQGRVDSNAQAEQAPQAAHDQAMASLPKTPQDAVAAPQAPQTPAPASIAQQPIAAPAPGTPPSLTGSSQPASDPYGTNAQYGYLSKGINQQMAGIQGQAFAESQMAKAQAATLQAEVEQQKAHMADFQAKSKLLETERQHFQDDIVKTHIDPNKYLGDMSTGKRVLSAIGLILGGIGGGINHQENPALKFLNQQIDRDIGAQKSNLDTKQTLLSANLKQFGVLRDATDMTRVMMADTMANQLKMEAAKSADPMAKARALQAAGQITAQYAPIMGQIAMRQSLLSGVQAGRMEPSAYLRAVVPEHEKAGVAKEIQEAQNMSQLRDNVLQAFDQIAQLNTVAGNTAHPIDNQRKISALRGAALDKLTKDTSGRVTPETVKLIEGLFPQAGSGADVNPVQRAQLNKLLTQGMHFPLAEQYMSRELLTRGTMTGNAGQSKFKEMPPVLPSK